MSTRTKIIILLVAIILILTAVTQFNKNMPAEQGNQNATTTAIEETTYTNDTIGFSIDVPKEYARDETYSYQVSPNKLIPGVKFTIPASVATGTNLSSDTYISVESIADAKNCNATLFLDGVHPLSLSPVKEVPGYTVASSSGAGAGNRYEETVYAYNANGKCIAIRYFIHYGVFQNFPEGSIVEFNEQAIVSNFDAIRKTLVIK